MTAKEPRRSLHESRAARTPDLLSKGVQWMSVMNVDKIKVVLPRSGPDAFWTEVHRSYAGEDQRAWKYLAMFTLRVNGGWAVEHIGRAFGHPKGHVTRCLRRIEQDLRERFAPPADLWVGFGVEEADDAGDDVTDQHAAGSCDR